ncbi:amidohydrolase family protein [Flexivirga alba]|uniref:Amidohydrolase family protein n=1 Tax=Flexivirga alba TaxID=702742 RepID=A0ABW2AE21_9MICO
MRVDAHCHIISNNLETYPQNPLGGKQSKWAAARPVTAEGLLDRMDSNGIDQAVLVQATTNYGYDNSYVVDSARRWPDRFTVVGTVDPVKPGAASWLPKAHEEGLAGVRLFTAGSTLTGQSNSFVSAESDEFWLTAGKLGVPVCLQLKLDSALDELHTVLASYPEVTVLLDHCGYPDVEADPAAAAQTVVELARYPRLFLKLTHRTLEPLDRLGESAINFLRPVIDAFTADRIAWGSNCPAAEQPMEELVGLANDVLDVLSDDEREGILSRTARVLYPSLEVGTR